MIRTTNQRLVVMCLISLGALGALWVRCVWLQGISASRYATLAGIQQRTHETLTARRGALLDRTGRALAISLPTPSVYANARRVVRKHETARALARIVGGETKGIQRRLEQDRGFVWIARQVDRDKMPQIQALASEGIGTVEEMTRVYPQGRMASHLLGCVNIDQQGLEGLELEFNGVLRGQDGWRSTRRDGRGERVLGPWTIETPPVDGYDLVLTVDRVVQHVAEETLDWGVKKFHARGGSIVVLDPASGAILAMANAPTYDAHAPTRAPMSHRRNRVVTDVFEPGSTFKIVTAAALLETGRMTPTERIFCEEGSFHTVGRHILHDHRPHGTLTFEDVIALSSNIGTAKAAQRLRPDELYRMIQAFGFGRVTEIDLPGEVRGFLHEPSTWSKLTPFILPIGQEVAVTPIQLAVMTAVVANGGFRVRPYVVERIQTSDGRVVRSLGSHASRPIIRAETARTLQQMLTRVVESGTGQLASVDGLMLAGKTGTAQKLESNGRFSHSRFMASFVGFGPVPDARFVIVVCVDEPRPAYFGGVVAAPMFKRMVEGLVSYWELRDPMGVEGFRAASSNLPRWGAPVRP